MVRTLEVEGTTTIKGKRIQDYMSGRHKFVVRYYISQRSQWNPAFVSPLDREGY
jgi:hypothetical protein